ncbi:TPR repeat protein [Agrobacterium vitis]|nr:TPR repeat protein [Agrobacterium vitis]MBE1436865.1 TPR repeat protein [Agrobacterium vitis]
MTFDLVATLLRISTCAGFLLAGSGIGLHAQEAKDRGPDPAVSGPATQPTTGADAGRMQRPGSPDKPSAGIELMERMGIPLPPLPPEKPYTGKIDLAYGAFQRGLFGTAFDYALPLAEKGDPASETLIAELMSRGLAVKKDMKGAAFWYAKAAKGGDPAAMFKYSLMLLEGIYAPKDNALADDYMRKAADAGNASAQFNWGQILVSQNPGVKGLHLALPYYEKSAEQGIADAQYAVAQIYRNLPDLPQDKHDKAREWLVRAARAGFDTAQLDMGIWLINGIMGPQNLDNGFNWLRIAANRGNVAAQNRLAHAYVSALGTRPDPVEAAKWFILSRRAGLNDANLEDFYLGLPAEQQKQAIDAANKYRFGNRPLGRVAAQSAAGKAGANKPDAQSAPASSSPTPSNAAVGLPGVSVPPAGVILPENDAGDDENTVAEPSAPATP